MLPKQFKLWYVSAIFGNIVIVGALTRCTPLHSVSNLKATLMNMQFSLIRGLGLYEFELSHNAADQTKTILCTKVKGTVDNSTVTRWLRRFCSGSKNLDDQVRSGWLKSKDSRQCSKLQRQIRGVALDVYQVGLASHSSARFVNFMTKSKAPWAAELCFILPKILQNFLFFLGRFFKTPVAIFLFLDIVI